MEIRSLEIDVRSNQDVFKVRAAWVKKIVRNILAGEKIDAEVSVLFVNDEEIAGLNQRYRHKKGPTDVLAFGLGTLPEVSPKCPLGDIVISTQTALRQAKSQRHPVSREIAFLLIHGALHLLGHDHKTLKERRKMFRKQEEYFRKAVT